MSAVCQRHVEPDKNDLLCPELDCQVDCLEARMTATGSKAAADDTRLLRKYLCSRLQRDLPQFVDLAGRRRRRELQTLKFRCPVVGYPPALIQTVKSVSPRRQLVRPLDYEDARPAPSELERGVLCARPRADDDCSLTSPVRPHYP